MLKPLLLTLSHGRDKEEVQFALLLPRKLRGLHEALSQVRVVRQRIKFLVCLLDHPLSSVGF